MSRPNPFLVSAKWLVDHLDRDDVAIVDASWYLPTMQRDGRAEYERAHIPGAVYFDIDTFSEPGSALPHTLASAEHFAGEAENLGISDQQTIVVYDGAGLFSVARAWWNFRIMGAAKVVILDGGFPAWLAEGFPVESGKAPVRPARFNAMTDPSSVTDFDTMRAVVEEGEKHIADARPPGRFSGKDAEPRPGLRSGHMPGAINIPVNDLVSDGRLLPMDELESVLESRGISQDRGVVTTCGSGVTAAIISLALESTGHRNHSLYDGSWSEWGSRADTPVTTDEGG